MTIYSWNINGIRAAVGKSFLEELDASKADVYCLQEVKAQEDQVETALAIVEDYYIYTNAAERKGYSGVSVLTKTLPVNVTSGIGKTEHDQEGRVLTIELDQAIIVNVYVPNSGNELVRLPYRREWDAAFANYIGGLRGNKPVVVTGDFNVAHQAIDLARPKSNYNKTSGYTQDEIDGMDLLLNAGFVDSFRALHPEKVQYSFWSNRFGARANNVGWRLDYLLVDRGYMDKVRASEIHDAIKGSDHCPISLDIDI